MKCPQYNSYIYIMLPKQNWERNLRENVNTGDQTINILQ